MRIISGYFKKKKLLLPDQNITRPLRDYVKESIFNFLLHNKNIKFDFHNSNILDIFSGSGSFGIECLSRGSAKVFFIEKNIKTLKILTKNIESINSLDKCEIINKDILNIDFIKLFKDKIDLIFLDPPFSKNIINEVVNDISKLNSINDRCKIYIEIPSKGNFESSIITPRNWELLKCKKSGGVAYLLFQHNCSMI